MDEKLIALAKQYKLPLEVVTSIEQRVGIKDTEPILHAFDSTHLIDDLPEGVIFDSYIFSYYVVYFDEYVYLFHKYNKHTIDIFMCN